MSVAALEARALAGLLSTHGAALAARDPTVHKLAAEVQRVLKPRTADRDAELVSRGLALMAEG